MVEYSNIAVGYPRAHQPSGSKPLSLACSDIIVSGWDDGRCSILTYYLICVVFIIVFAFIVMNISSYSVIAHDIDTGENLWFIEKAHPDGVTSLRLSHNMRFVLTGGMHGEVRLWELRSRELISHLKEHTQRITDIVIYPDDTMCMTASRDRCIMHWDLREEVRDVLACV